MISSVVLAASYPYTFDDSDEISHSISHMCRFYSPQMIPEEIGLSGVGLAGSIPTELGSLSNLGECYVLQKLACYTSV